MDNKIIYENLENIPFVFRNYLYNFLGKIKEVFKGKLLSMILFGSVARGKWTNQSDIDLFLIFSNNSLKHKKLERKLIDIILKFEEINELLDQNGNNIHASIQPITLLLKDLDNFRTLFYDFAMDGKIIFDKNEIGLKFIKKIKKRIKSLGLKRIFIDDNDFYWKHKDVKFGEIIEI